MTKVIRVIPGKFLFLLALLLHAPALIAAQSESETSGQPAISGMAGTPSSPAGSAQDLYLQLRNVGLDKSRVYKVRDLALDRAAFHVTLEDGTIAFTQDVAGRVTGAFFEGDGEVLLIPPDQVERASMALFTGAAILEEGFTTAYFRFNDDTFTELQPALRPADDSQEFVSQWNETAHNLAEGDALRLFMTFSQLLPMSQSSSAPGLKPSTLPAVDQMLHARLQGKKLGIFDLYFDSIAAEQIWAGQLKIAEGATFYDVWTSFSLPQPNGRTDDARRPSGEEGTSDPINVLAYKIQVEVEPPTKLDGQASLTLKIRQGGQRTLLFELSRFLVVRQVQADGRQVEFIHNQALEGTQLARRGNDLVAVVFPEPLRSGQKIDLYFAYGGEVLSEAGGGLLYVGARGTWYPNRGLGMSSFDLQFRYPLGWTLVATGKRINTASPAGGGSKGANPDLPPGLQLSRWISERPIPVAGFNLGKYSRVVAHAGEVVVETYAASGMERSFPKGTVEASAPEPLIPPGLRPPPREITVLAPSPSPAHNAQVVADRSARAIEFYERRFGPYPYSGLSLTQMPGDLSQGWPALIFLSSFSFLTPEEKSQLHMSPVEKVLSNEVIAHETAHQWWGDLVSWRGYRDQWIFEALANYSSLMLLEVENPAQFRAVLEKYREDLLAKNKLGGSLYEAGPVTLGTRLISSHFPGGYEAISYGRGTWLFHMLRNMMRDAQGKRSAHVGGDVHPADEPFVRALRKIRERYQGKAITSRELLRVFEEELPPSLWYENRRSLDWFYQGWVNGTALPRLQLQDLKYSDQPDATTVSGTILQKDAPQDLVTPVPLFAVLHGKTVPLGRIFADGPETSFHLSAPAGARKIVLDAYQTLLTKH